MSRLLVTNSNKLETVASHHELKSKVVFKLISRAAQTLCPGPKLGDGLRVRGGKGGQKTRRDGYYFYELAANAVGRHLNPALLGGGFWSV